MLLLTALFLEQGLAIVPRVGNGGLAMAAEQGVEHLVHTWAPPSARTLAETWVRALVQARHHATPRWAVSLHRHQWVLQVAASTRCPPTGFPHIVHPGMDLCPMGNLHQVAT